MISGHNDQVCLVLLRKLNDAVGWFAINNNRAVLDGTEFGG